MFEPVLREPKCGAVVPMDNIVVFGVLPEIGGKERADRHQLHAAPTRFGDDEGGDAACQASAFERLGDFGVRDFERARHSFILDDHGVIRERQFEAACRGIVFEDARVILRQRDGDGVARRKCALEGFVEDAIQTGLGLMSICHVAALAVGKNVAIFTSARVSGISRARQASGNPRRFSSAAVNRAQRTLANGNASLSVAPTRLSRLS
jgi:hypothetical protein